jgi:hypothetical protein
MAKKFLTGLNLVVLDVDPATGSEGELYFNSSASVAKIYQAGSWSVLGAGGGGTTVSTTEPESPEIGDSWYKNDTGEFYIYDGTYWVEVNGVIENPPISQEEVQDYIAPLFEHGNHINITATYDDVNNEILLEGVSAVSGSLSNIDSIVYPDYITFDTTPENLSEEAGTLSWDTDFQTLKLQANDTTLQLGQEHVVRVKNASGSTAIPNMSVVMFAGSAGDTVTVSLATSTQSYEPEMLLGITTEEIDADGFGFVTQFGFVNKVDTSDWELGDLLYSDPANPGQLTNVKPSAPNWTFPIAAVTRVHANTGRILVRAIPGLHLHDIVDVAIDSELEDQVLRYSSSASVWMNTAENIITAKNVNESTIDAFMPVYIDTETLGQSQILFDLANATGSAYNAKMPADAITTASVASGEFSKLATHGAVRGADLSAYSDGDLLYVAPEGGLTNIRPTGNNTIQPFARVISVDNGTLFVLGNTFVSYIESLPNLETNKVWLGTSGRPVETTLDTSIVPENTNLYFTDERAQDAAAELFTTGVHTGASVEYNDSTGKINITNTGVTSVYGTANEIEVSSNNGEVTISIPDSPVFVTPNIGVATATSINGTSIPTSASLVVSTDLEDYLTTDSASSTYLTQTDASTTYQPIGSYLTSESDPIFSASDAATITSASISNWDESYGWGDHASAGYLTSYSESDTLETVTDRGATSTNAITISNTTQSTTPTTGALIVSGGLGVSKDVWIDGDLHVNGTTITENTKTVATSDNLIYLNAAQDSVITNAVYSSGSITYTAENKYTAGMDIRITGIDPAGFNISTGDGLVVGSATLTEFVVVKADPGATYVSGGTAHAKEEANPDLGFAGGYYDAGYAHAGLFRDASDGVFKFFEGYTPEPDEAVNIDTTDPSFTLADITANDATFTGIVSASVLNLTEPLDYSYGGTGLSSLGTAGQVIKVNSTEDGLEWGTGGGGGGSSAAAVTSDPPSSPELNQVWQDLDTGRIYVWDGDFWIEVQQNGSLGLLRYLGASSTAPTTSIDGSDLQVGEVYFDTVFNGMKVYDGTDWEDAFSAASLSTSRWVKTAIGGETDLSGNDDNSLTLVYTPGIEEVYLNGVKLIRGSDYIASSGSMISNLEPLSANSVVEVISYSGFTVANTYTKTEVDDLIQKKGVRWTLVAGVGTSITTLSGSDDYLNNLEYTPGTEQVFINGILIVRGVDYTATDGTSVVLNTALTPGDVVEVIGNSAFSISNTYTKAEIDAKDADIMVFALSDEFSNLTTGSARVTFRAPFAMTLIQIPRSSLSTSSSSGLPTVDINVNGTSILGANKLSIDINEKTSVTATTPTTLATTGILDDAEITFDIDVAGTGAKGLKVVLYYKRA